MCVHIVYKQEQGAFLREIEDPAGIFIDVGGAPEDPERLKRYRDLGVVRMNVRLPPATADEILPVLDRWAKLIPQLH